MSCPRSLQASLVCCTASALLPSVVLMLITRETRTQFLSFLIFLSIYKIVLYPTELPTMLHDLESSLGVGIHNKQ